MYFLANSESNNDIRETAAVEYRMYVCIYTAVYIILLLKLSS